MLGLARKIFVAQHSLTTASMSDWISSWTDWVARIIAAFFLRHVFSARVM